MKCLPLDSEVRLDGPGFKVWERNNQYHSFNDQPSYKSAAGHLFWRKDGYIHRGYDKPAVIQIDGTKLWYEEGRCTKSEYP